MDPLDVIAGARAGEISTSVEDGLRAGTLVPGQLLPTVRHLAEQLRISPTTVAAAYRDLQLRGFVTAAGRRGTRVSPRPPLAARSPVVAPPGVRNLATGNPDPDFLPDLTAAIRTLSPDQHLYGEPCNQRGLLALAAETFARDGISPDFLAITGGALDGIERTLGAHLRPGDRVAVEDPCYPAVHDLVLAMGLVPRPVAVDDRGPLPEALEEALGHQIAAAIITPRAQNPTGAALDEGRVGELGEVLAQRPDVLVIEDDHAGPVAGVPVLTLAHEQIPERWAVLRSVSKWLGPDLRLAMMAGDPITISRVEGRQQIGAGWISHVLQDMVTMLWRDTATQLLVERGAAIYTERRLALLEALADRGITAHGRSGLNVWVDVEDEQATQRALLDAGWAASVGERYRLRTPPAVRISIGSMQAHEAAAIAEAVAGPGAAQPRSRSA
ncbi:MAG: aminotransferase class I/II-fold pyridoxal phosphate-dependent enzyme [Candidatus Dormibacteraeota bacterium]|nr:aminotransferase class I/II-fold pyridoxal phosphate-dependent enzyme [Candidatus Dormibacteraeota bacterium]MBO0761190.1 aminotransferase class I/II-fold pyridoxal phosphate-dependent enzyme [Candidatus Dormibacteraeota bacterium]